MNIICSPSVLDSGHWAWSSHTGCPPSFARTSVIGAATGTKTICRLGLNQALPGSTPDTPVCSTTHIMPETDELLASARPRFAGLVDQNAITKI
ncbi:hypothetical protein [Myceligenerans xiligouense]|uniref:hypothetical protein n=1 Tax=Myceligenerans xiligouense TaxID=253184 RepID=UPI000F5150FE|nr:hypothetical protein [Myceligenerans xiligouense]